MHVGYIDNPMDTVRQTAAIYDGDNNVYGGGSQGTATEQALTGQGSEHNFGFTSEITYWFAFEEETSASFEFVGDDDVWVFVNNKLALDLGGKHTAASSSFSLEGTAPDYGMAPGNVYEIKVFHAERQPYGSTFKMTLAGFDTSRSDCRPECGDGIVAFGEQCDEGPENGLGYNRCGKDCKLGSYCGDGVVDEGEACDDADPETNQNCSNCRVIVLR